MTYPEGSNEDKEEHHNSYFDDTEEEDSKNPIIVFLENKVDQLEATLKSKNELIDDLNKHITILQNALPPTVYVKCQHCYDKDNAAIN